MQENCDYPDVFLRGVSNPQDIVDELPQAGAFQFLDNPLRTDGMQEASINWLDDDGARTILLSQEKDNKPQFKYGYIELSTQEFKRVMKVKIFQDGQNLAYERHELDGNKYHGNLLYRNNQPPALKKMMQSTIAVMCTLKCVKRRETID